MPRKLFVTTALPYANGPLHIGHIVDQLYGDIWVRFQRMQGHEVHFVCAGDTHGAPIMLRAEQEGISPETLIERVGAEQDADWRAFLMSYDHWHSTHSPENVELTQDIYRKLKAAKLIASKEIEQFFDPVKEMFLPDRYIKGECPKCGAKDQYGDSCEMCGAVYAPTDLKNPYSALTGAKPVLKTSEHFFFKLSDKKCIQFLQEWTKETALQSEVVNKLDEWLGDGGKNLNDWDISRDAPYFGIEIPDEPGKYFYVWLSAPVGYLASLKAYFDSGKAKAHGEKRGFDEFLADDKVEQYHFIGKDIVYHHTLFWPAMLKFSGRKVPNNVFVHGFITFTGEKMSKSRGTGVSPQKYIQIGMNPEWLRYYIAAKLTDKVEDLDFNPDDFVARVNSDLIGKYVNIASRSAGFISRKFAGRLGKPQLPKDIAGEFAGAAEEISGYYDGREYGKAIRKIMALADLANQFVDTNKPWDLAKQDGKDAGDDEEDHERLCRGFEDELEKRRPGHGLELVGSADRGPSGDLIGGQAVGAVDRQIRTHLLGRAGVGVGADVHPGRAGRVNRVGRHHPHHRTTGYDRCDERNDTGVHPRRSRCGEPEDRLGRQPRDGLRHGHVALALPMRLLPWRGRNARLARHRPDPH